MQPPNKINQARVRAKSPILGKITPHNDKSRSLDSPFPELEMIEDEDNVTSPICAKPKIARKASSEITENTISEPSAKRQKLATNSIKKSARDMPPERFMSIVDLCNDAKIRVVVDGRRFELPRLLLCHSSTYFDREIQTAIAEGQKQEVALDDISVDSFELAIKWIFTGNLALSTSSTKGQDTIARLIEFLNLADDFGLLGPFDSVYDEIKSVLVKSRSCLTSQHIRWAMGSPIGNPIRVLIMKACVKPFIESIKQRKQFKFHRELIEFESFAAGLMRYFAEATSHRRDGESRSGYIPTIKDPLTGEDIKAEFDKQ